MSDIVSVTVEQPNKVDSDVEEQPISSAVVGVRGIDGKPGPPGPTGATGAQGPQGLAGDTSFVHVQGTPATSWTIVHGLGKYPVPTVLDSAGDEVEPDWTYVDTTTIVLTFSALTMGTAYLN